MPAKRQPPPKAISRIVFAIIAVAIVFWVRPLLYPFVFGFYAAPLVWLLPLLIFAVGAVVTLRSFRRPSRPEVIDDPRRSLLELMAEGRDWSSAQQARARSLAPLVISAALAFGVFVAMGILNGPLVAKQLYSHTTYAPIDALPPSGAVRIVPKEVAQRVAASGFNSPTEHLSDFHLIRRDGRLAWTALRTPDGAYRALTQQTAGSLELNASSTSRQTRLVDGTFKTAPGMFLTDNLTWRLRKQRFFAELDDPIAITDAAGKPLIAVSYVKYKGWFIRRPVFGGVFIVHPDGKIEDLSPAEAVRRKELVDAGRIFPERLARRLQEAFAYQKGLFNKWFSHEDQTQISRTENNPQPYLLDFGKRGLKYVSAAEPFGRAFAVNAVFLTDAVSGKTEIWRPPRDADLTGNRRVLETVRSLSIPGIVFAEGTSNAPSDRGGFRVVEPRPIVVRGRLLFMTSIVPDNANNVSKTVFVDARSNRVAAVFDNDSDDRADAKIVEFLKSGAAPGAGSLTEGGDRATGATGATGSTGPTAQDIPDARERVEDLLRRQRELVEELEKLRDQLPR
ncbi:MAG: hypothetical protein WAO61_04095 [Solirubrobacterales bacterium]